MHAVFDRLNMKYLRLRFYASNRNRMEVESQETESYLGTIYGQEQVTIDLSHGPTRLAFAGKIVFLIRSNLLQKQFSQIHPKIPSSIRSPFYYALNVAGPKHSWH